MRMKLMFYAFCLIAFVACDPQNESEEVEFVATQDVEIEVAYYTHTLDDGNNLETISYRIHYKNPNDFPVRGYAQASVQHKYKTETLVINGSPRPKASSCPLIEANETCTDEFYVQSQLDTDLYDPDDLPDISLIDIEYTITEELR